MNHFLEIGGVQVESPWKTVDINAGDIRVDLNTGRIDVPDLSVNRINCSHLIEHLDYPGIRKFFREIYRILDVNGIASFVVPNTDSNSWWKGFFEHYDLRMNPYFFRSISKAPDSQLINKHEMWPDYDGHPFGMLMGYSQEGFDFEILEIKTFNTKTFSLLSGDSKRYANLHIYNTVDSYRIFLKKRMPGAEYTEFNYISHLTQLPRYEVQRDVDYLCTKVRAFLDFSDVAINQSGVLLSQSVYKVHQSFYMYDFLENCENVLLSLKNELNEFLPYEEMISKDTLQYLKSGISLCEERGKILTANRRSFAAFIGFRKEISSTDSTSAIFDLINSYEARLKAIEVRWWNRALIKITDRLKNIF